MNNIDYRMVLALILVPEGEIDDLESDFHQLAGHVGLETAMVAWADTNTYDQYGQVTRNGPDEGTMVMAKLGPGVPAGRATIREPYLGTIELSGLGTPGRAISPDLARTTHPDYDWSEWDCPTNGCGSPDFTWGGLKGDHVVCVTCMEEWTIEELSDFNESLGNY